jgi:hypothetical protein
MKYTVRGVNENNEELLLSFDNYMEAKLEQIELESKSIYLDYVFTIEFKDQLTINQLMSSVTSLNSSTH